MERRFGVLRFVGTVYKILAIIVALLTILVVIALCAGGALTGGLMQALSQNTELGAYGQALGSGAAGAMGAGLAIAAVLYGGVAAITLYAFGEAIYLFLALEENTRATAAALHKMGEPPAS